MGCLFSKAEEATQRALGAKYAVGPDSAPASPIKPSGGAASSGSSARSNVVNAPLVPAKAKLDPKDFIFLERKGEKLVKPPGSVAGQQFCIDACEDCEIYVLDHCDSLTIDDCKRCTIVVGPTSGSVFIRDCESCTCVFMCRQYRSRDCVDCDTHLHVTTRPIIETSANMRFGCWDFHYPALEAQMATLESELSMTTTPSLDGVQHANATRVLLQRGLASVLDTPTVPLGSNPDTRANTFSLPTVTAVGVSLL